MTDSFSLHWLSFTLAWVAIAAAPLWSQERSADDVEFFEKKIRPVLVEHCYECHSADAKAIRGGLRVDSREAFRNGGDSGAAVVPGHLDQGTLLDALRYETFEMPPKQKLPESVIRDFETWISLGAPDPREDVATTPPEHEIDLQQGRQFWSFQPIQQRARPKVDRTTWPIHEIDTFILAAQEQHNLLPGPDADELTLLRRLCFDLTGLPPTVTQIDRFLQDNSGHRVENIVDELLASPRFGERWGRHWLDLARYSDSTGGGRSLLYGEAWRYRNYVIDSLNDDKPYDVFIREQIAGDLLQSEDFYERQQQIIATAFLALGPHNYENQDKEQLRMDVVDEQIDTMGRVFLGMTLGCARCHDHKFDPIPTTDYYALAGIFRSTNSLVDGNVSRWVSTPLPRSPEQARQLAEFQEQQAQTKHEIEQLQQRIETLKSALPAVEIDNLQAELSGDWTNSTSVKGFRHADYQHSSDVTASAQYSFDVEPGMYEVRISYTEHGNRTRKAKVTVRHADGETESLINQQLAPNVDGTWHRLGEFPGAETLVVTIQPTEQAATIIDAVQIISKSDISDQQLSENQQQIEQAEFRIRELEKRLKRPAPVQAVDVVSVADVEQPADYFVCIRGNPHNLGAPVRRGFLSVIGDLIEQPPSAQQSGRLELAEWITHPQNPLTARVYVNRIWHHLFGAGIVRTVDNFGAPGESPSHPELLDSLARSFMDGGWSTKRLIRHIVLSRTYQLSSQPTGDVTNDADNRFLTHQNRRRLSAEEIHDAMFVASAELDFAAIDDAVRPGTKSEYGYAFEFGHRAVYLPVFRNRLPDVLTVFDFPDPNLSRGRRTSSTISPQSLFLMNSEFVSQRSRATARRVLKLHDDPTSRLNWLSLSILGRYPHSDETRLFDEFLDGDSDSLDRWTSICQTLFASLDFRFVK